MAKLDLPTSPLQAMVDGMNAAAQRVRAGEQVTLGAFIALLGTLDQSREVLGLGELISYRGYYCDLAFDPRNPWVPDRAKPGCFKQGRVPPRCSVAALSQRCRDAMGKVFTGYKGGDYMMGENTPLWVSAYGEASGEKLIGLNVAVEPMTHIVEKETWD